MTKKGKKKKQQNKQEGASTSDTTDEPLQSPSTSQPQQEQQQQTGTQKKTLQQSVEKPQQGPQEQAAPQLQGAWAKKQQQTQLPSQQQQQMPTHPPQQQQMPAHPPQQRPQGAWVRPQQQQQKMPTQPPQQQPQGAWIRPQQQQQQMPTQPQQQQPQGAWTRPQQQQQQIPTHPPQQRPQGAWVRPQQQQQQVPTQPPQQQQQMPTPPPQQQQQMPIQPPQQQPQGAWVRPQQQQQQMPTQPQQQQPQGAWTRPQQQQQQTPTSLPQQRPQGAWGRPQQQQQQMPTSLPQQQPQGAWTQPQQQQQKVSVDIGGAGDSRQIQTRSSDIQQPQPSTSAESLKMSELSMRDTLQPTKTSSKAKMTSSAMKQYQLCIPKRRNPMKGGTLGTPIRVVTNMFEVIFNKNFVTNAIHYDVSITPNAPKRIHKRVFDACRNTYFGKRHPAYDGKKNAYSANDLPFNDYMETDIEIREEDSDRQRTFKIALKKVAVIDLSWIKNLRPGLDEADRDQTGIQVLDIIMRHAAEVTYNCVGRSIYWDVGSRRDEEKINLGKGLILGTGGFSSTIPGWKAYLNVDVAHKAFPSPENVAKIITDMVNEFKGLSGSSSGYPTRPSYSKPSYSRQQTPLTPGEIRLENSPEMEKIDKFLKGLKVTYEIPNQVRSKRTYRLNGLGPRPDQHKFECNNEIITITKYFAEHKMYKLKYPQMPCLWAGAKDREEKIFLPAELCIITPGQSYNRKLDDGQTTKMIKQTAKSAPERRLKIEDAFKKLNVNQSSTVRQEFNLSVCPNMKEVDARILPPPQLKYKKGKDTTSVTPIKGIWHLHQFIQPENLSPRLWTILDLSRNYIDKTRDSGDRTNDRMFLDLTQIVISTAKDVGMEIGEALTSQFKAISNRATAEITKYFRDCKEKKLKLIIVIIPAQTDVTYSKVKQITELEIGILTQCIKYDTTTRKMNPSTVKNILLKINSKLNGINHIFGNMPMCLQNNSCCMLVGADVTHPSPDSVDIPSIAAVAASQDIQAFQYNAALRLQQPKEEMILDLEDIITSQICIYKDKTKFLPKKIIYYRDGVSEGQLPQVMHFEINAIRRACKKFETPKDIEITCLIVQKRHHVRLFPTRQQDSDDRNGNVKAGTIVDTEITHPNHIDFYLVSHASIQGTARPTKYRCICNDSNYTENEIEELTYYLCHMYARCARSVSYPAPTYYAHLAAYRGRALIQGINIRLNNLDAEQEKLKMKLPETIMYYI
nr:PREDICTED: protein argonaute-2 isoform X1 [Linepithema humile]XP_012231084.1 PREDICTED: protein argonaute-2 isoform X1 [Linepithema humile]